MVHACREQLAAVPWIPAVHDPGRPDQAQAVERLLALHQPLPA